MLTWLPSAFQGVLYRPTCSRNIKHVLLESLFMYKNWYRTIYPKWMKCSLHVYWLNKKLSCYKEIIKTEHRAYHPNSLKKLPERVCRIRVLTEVSQFKSLQSTLNTWHLHLSNILIPPPPRFLNLGKTGFQKLIFRIFS